VKIQNAELATTDVTLNVCDQNSFADWRKLCGSTPDRLSGAPFSKGTRIPVQMLIDHLAAGFSLDEFLETEPSLERGQAQRFLELAGEQMKECASSLMSV
jgi:uncharacterized protein (DUF433 family)